MADKDRIHRWITQADLERMLADAYRKGTHDAAQEKPVSTLDLVARLQRERDEARADVAAAYRKGAEAMREAAAQEMFRLRDRYNERINVMRMIGAEVPDHLGIAREEAGCHMDIIRALPLPEGRR